MYSDTTELIELAKVVAEYNGLIHPISEAKPVLCSMRSTSFNHRYRIGARVEISHHKAAGRLNWGKVAESYALIEAAAKDHDVTFDIYPIRRAMPH